MFIHTKSPQIPFRFGFIDMSRFKRVHDFFLKRVIWIRKVIFLSCKYCVLFISVFQLIKVSQMKREQTLAQKRSFIQTEGNVNLQVRRSKGVDTADNNAEKPPDLVRTCIFTLSTAYAAYTWKITDLWFQEARK